MTTPRTPAPLRVLGIDPGTRHLGWGVLDQHGTRVEHVAHGVIDTDTDRGLASRLVEIDDALERIIAEYRPNVGAVEATFFAKDAQAASKLGHARGVVLLRLARAGVAIDEMPPARVKRAVVGAGLASKEQVAKVITTVLGLDSPPRADAADALANAFAHLTMAKYAAAVEDALARSSSVKLPEPYRAARAARSKVGKASSVGAAKRSPKSGPSLDELLRLGGRIKR
jgi:crossover junction endodeoxyribonuclease RuvC